MANFKHILIWGERHAGKSTLIRRLTDEMDCPFYGYITKRVDLADENGYYPIYMHPAEDYLNPEYADRIRYEETNCIGHCGSQSRQINLHVFNENGVKYIRSAKPGGVLIMDELGFMESGADLFRSAVLEALDGDIPVICGVKEKPPCEFTDEILAHQGCKVWHVTVENRDELFEEIRAYIKANCKAARL